MNSKSDIIDELNLIKNGSNVQTKTIDDIIAHFHRRIYQCQTIIYLKANRKR